MSNKKQILSKITRSLNNAIKAKNKDLCTFCENMLKANEEIDNLAQEYKGEKNEKSISKRYFDWSVKNKEFPLQRFNGIITFVDNPKNKQGIGRIFKESLIVKISKLVKKALQAFDYLMRKIGGHKMWKRIIKYNNEDKTPISYKTAAIIYDGIVHSRDDKNEIAYINLDVAKDKEDEWLTPICNFFGYVANPHSSGGEYLNIAENVWNCDATDKH